MSRKSIEDISTIKPLVRQQFKHPPGTVDIEELLADTSIQAYPEILRTTGKEMFKW